MKKHASLRAGVSTAERFEIGGDDGRIVFDPAAHLPILDAIEALRATFVSDEIATRTYPTHKIAAFGPDRWLDLDMLISPIRANYLLSFLVAVARKPEPIQATVGDPMTPPPEDLAAAELLSLIAHRSQRRGADGLTFWGGEFRRRISARAHLDLRTFVARLLRDLRVGDIGAEPVIRFLDALPPETAPLIMTALRSRGAVLAATAYTILKDLKATLPTLET